MNNSCRSLFKYAFFYAVYWAMSASITQYLGLFYVSRGLSGFNISLLGSLYSCFGIIFSLAIGYYSDRKGSIRIILLVTCIIGFISVIFLRLSYSILPIVFSVLGLSFCLSTPGGLVDEQLMRKLGKKTMYYAYFRMWGPVGFAISSLICFFLMQRNGLSAVFDAFALFNILLFFTFFFFKDERCGKKRVKQPVNNSKVLFKNNHFIWSLVLLCLWGACEVGMFQYFNLYFVDLGFSVSLTGIGAAMAMLGEFVSYMMVSRILNTSQKHFKIVSVGFAVVVIQYLLFIFSDELILLMFAKMFGGAGFSFVWVPITELFSKKIPPGNAFFAQECKNVALSGVGCVIGNFLCGMSMDYSNLKSAFSILMVLALIAIIICAYMQKMYNKNINMNIL